MATLTKFTELMHKYMKRANMSDSTLAEKLDIKRETVFRWRKGTIKSPTCSKVEISAKVFALNPIERNEFLIAAGCPNPSTLQTFKSDVNIKTVSAANLHPFFGHEDLLARVFNTWKSLPLEHIAIIGPKQSGKTSLLNYIHQTQFNTLSNTQQTDQYQWIFIDFKNVQMHNPESFMRYLLKNLNPSCDTSGDLTELAETLNDSLNKPTILLMDNIEYGLKLPKLDELFWGYLRSLGEHIGQLGYCVSSRLSLLELEELSEKIGKPSPLVNIFANELELQPFTKTEAQKFLKLAHVPSKDSKWILDQCQYRWPILLQIFCKARLEESKNNWQEISLKKIQRYKHFF
ncbi:AAA family ATPase [Candidatus Halobeggiatoa sp. HSG11]|nr:AAA family ATPase [Candidatus Halobeggiatoa sp. HSG11]